MASKGHTLYIFSLVIYIILAQPTLFALFRHGRHGILGWFYLQFFCCIRTVGSIIELKAESNGTTNSTAVVIVNSVGLSPLILAALGVMHEARRARNMNLRRKLEWFFVINFHVIVSAAVVAVVIGIVHVENNHQKPSTSHIIKIGLAIVFITWLTLLAWAILSLRAQRHTDAILYANGSVLLKGVIVAMPFIGCRLVYGILSFTLSDPSFANSLAWKVALSVIPEVVVTAVIAIVGLATRNMWREQKAAAKVEAYPQQPLHGQVRPGYSRPGQAF